MGVGEFHLVTEWLLDAPVESVRQALLDVEQWPDWWPSVRSVEIVEKGEADGVGAVHRLRWRTALPYDLVFEMQVTCLEPERLIEGQAAGELDGTGRWTLAARGNRTHVRYDWSVRVTRIWMRWLAPVLRPVFAWNHGRVMDTGRQGLARRLAQR